MIDMRNKMRVAYATLRLVRYNKVKVNIGCDTDVIADHDESRHLQTIAYIWTLTTSASTGTVARQFSSGAADCYWLRGSYLPLLFYH